MLCLRTLILATVCAVSIAAQQSDKAPTKPGSGDASANPLPAASDLLARSRANSDTWAAIRKSYISKEVSVADEFDSSGNNKGSHSDEYRVFFVEGTEIHQHVAHDGKPLSPSDAKKEQERVDKQAAKAKDHQPEKQDDIAFSFSTLLKETKFSNERREDIDGRPTIVFDYTGNPEASAKTLSEEIVKRLRGHVWIDEEDAAVARVDGELMQNFRVAGGLLVNVKQGSHFTMDATRVNGEIWFVHEVDLHADGRILLFKGFNGQGHVTFSDYRKLKTSVKLEPGMQVIGDDGRPLPTVLEAPPEAPPAEN